MAATHNRAEITSADTKQLGFEYQYLYFIVKLSRKRTKKEYPNRLPRKTYGFFVGAFVECVDDRYIL